MRLELKVFPMLALVVAVLFPMESARAQDISGTWQGTLNVGAVKRRMVLHIDKTGSDWNGMLGDPAPAQAQANAFEKGVPQARVVRFPRALHFFFLTNEPIALNQINMFVATLP